MDSKLALSIYKTMNNIRNFEERIYELFKENKLRGSVHLYTGEEAIASAICAQLDDNDYIASTHRGHGHCIAKGACMKRAMAELMGKETGYCRGRSGSMHIADVTKGNLGANAIVGGGIPIATGAALALKLQKRPHVAVTFFGDGASNEGTFHEAINFAAIHKLPCIFVCENNGVGMSTSVKESTSVEDISVRASGYNIPGVTVDGNDVLAVYDAFACAKARALAGDGPTLLECKTYRWRGHWTGDPEAYRTREDVEEHKKDDCIARFREYILSNALVEVSVLEEIETQSKADVEEAVAFALSSPEPDPATVMENVFFEA